TPLTARVTGCQCGHSAATLTKSKTFSRGPLITTSSCCCFVIKCHNQRVNVIFSGKKRRHLFSNKKFNFSVSKIIYKKQFTLISEKETHCEVLTDRCSTHHL